MLRRAALSLLVPILLAGCSAASRGTPVTTAPTEGADARGGGDPSPEAEASPSVSRPAPKPDATPPSPLVRDDAAPPAPPATAGGSAKSAAAADRVAEVASSAPPPERHKREANAPAAAPAAEPTAGPRAPPPPSPSVAARMPEAPAMKAGRHDDNKEYNRFQAFLAENRSLVAFPVDVSERLVLRALDRDGKSLPNCAMLVDSLDGKRLFESVTYADGRTQFFPAADARPTDKDFAVTARCAAETRRGQAQRLGRREIEVRFTAARALPPRTPVDVAIAIDTTGSMQSQIDRLKKTLRAIHFQLTELPSKPDVRFGLVAFRDRGDDYVTQVTPFTSDVASFQRVLDGLQADGGGDTPEDMQAALEKSLTALTWRPDAVRIGFVISDAVPHTDYADAKVDYREAMRQSLRRGIKWVMVGAGGLGRDGEVIYRQIAQYTMAEYVFITDSGPGDHDGGAGEASHHVGTNYKTENLDQAIVRIVRRELSYLGDSPKDFDDTIVVRAQGSTPPPRDEVLGPAVEEVLRQLADYSSLRLAAHTPIAVVPVGASEARQKEVAGYLTERITLAASRSPSFRVVERDLVALAQEQKLQLSDLFDVTETVPIGKLVGAEALVVARLTVVGGEAALFAKLIRVETGEVLSVSRVDLGKTVIGGS